MFIGVGVYFRGLSVKEGKIKHGRENSYAVMNKLQKGFDVFEVCERRDGSGSAMRGAHIGPC
jgi:hypothetical protein